MLRKLNTSLLLTISYLILFLLLSLAAYILPFSSRIQFFSFRFFPWRILVYVMRYSPMIIAIIAIIEIWKRKKVVQPMIVLVICAGVYLFLYWISRPAKPIFHEDIGHISFEARKEKGQYRFYGKYNFDVQLGTELKSDDFNNEISLKKNDLLQMIKKAAIDNCDEKDLEKYINENCIDAINSKLEKGKIKEIDFENLSDSTSAAY